MVKFIKYFLLFLSLLIVVVISYFAFESLKIKKGTNYQNLEEIPKVNWLNIRSGVFGLVIKETIDKTLVSYDETKYLSVIAPSEERLEEYSEASLYYLASGIKYGEDTDTKLYKYRSVFRTKFKNNDYLLFLQENIQKNEKSGYTLIAYPVNLIQTKTVVQFIDMITNQSFPAPRFSSLYKFGSVENCNQKFNDKNYCQWLFSNQKAIYKIVKKWGDTGVVPIGMMRFPLIINIKRI